MNMVDFEFHGARLLALASGGLFWPDEGVLIVSDLHFGKSERLARRGGALLPPYEIRETLSRLDEDISRSNPRTVICLGDSFDDLTSAENLIAEEVDWITRLMAGRSWIWVEGNHDPGPIALGGSHRSEVRIAGLVCRHIAAIDGRGEISGHYHPKARIAAKGASLTRPCFLVTDKRVIMPAYGTYTGGLFVDAPVFQPLLGTKPQAILTGKTMFRVPICK